MAYTVPDNISEIRKTAWATRRAKYGAHGHSGTYSRFTLAERKRMTGFIIRLHAEGTISEGQAAKATGLDRVEVRRLREEME